MQGKTAVIFWGVLLFAVNACVGGQAVTEPNSTVPAGAIFTYINPGPVELARYGDEFSTVRVEPARVDTASGIAVIFKGTDDLHYYAKPETAPAAGFELKVQAKSDSFDFADPIFPKWIVIRDPLGNKVQVYVGRFTVFVPIQVAGTRTETATTDVGDIEVKISGIACTSMVCLPPFERTLRAKIDFKQRDFWKQISFEAADGADKAIKGSTYPALFALSLALLAGLSLNIMPCVWPVLPLIVMRIVEQAKAGKRQSITMGLAFCLGILLFFTSIAGANIVLKVFYGTVLQWGDQFRSPIFVAGMALLLVVLALFMFGVFTISVPSSISSKSGGGKGYPGAVGMGFLAALLSTPCSFAILAAAFAWAQAQPLLPATIAIMVIGVGMALPYAILTSMPGLLKRLPKAGQWMELFKQAVGFILLGIAAWMITVVAPDKRPGVLYFAVVLSFCVWMWGSWVGYNTKALKKWVVRIVAVVLAVLAGWALLRPAKALIDWQPYDGAVIESALNEGRPVLIKFMADWCLSCKAVDKIVYSRKDIANLIKGKNVLAVKADTTVKDYPATLALKNIYNEPGVPVSILFVPGRDEPVRWRDKFFGNELKTLLKKI